MPSGILGKAAPAATTTTTVYTVPSGKLATVNVCLCNRDISAAKVRVSLTTSASPTTADYILYDIDMGANATLERTGVVLQENAKVMVYASTANISAVVYGMEE